MPSARRQQAVQRGRGASQEMLKSALSIARRPGQVINPQLVWNLRQRRQTEKPLFVPEHRSLSHRPEISPPRPGFSRWRKEAVVMLSAQSHQPWPCIEWQRSVPKSQEIDEQAPPGLPNLPIRVLAEKGAKPCVLCSRTMRSSIKRKEKKKETAKLRMKKRKRIALVDADSTRKKKRLEIGAIGEGAADRIHLVDSDNHPILDRSTSKEPMVLLYNMCIERDRISVQR